MKFIISILVIVSLSGCGYFDRLGSHYTGHPTKVCFNGITYLQFTSGATIMVDQDGKPVKCSN